MFLLHAGCSADFTVRRISPGAQLSPFLPGQQTGIAPHGGGSIEGRQHLCDGHGQPQALRPQQGGEDQDQHAAGQHTQRRQPRRSVVAEEGRQQLVKRNRGNT